MPAPIGNKNAIGQRDTEKPFRDALRRAIAQDDGKRLRAAAERMIDLAVEGEAWACKELADRMDGKTAQQVHLTGAGDGPIQVQEVVRTIIDPNDPDS